MKKKTQLKNWEARKKGMINESAVPIWGRGTREEGTKKKTTPPNRRRGAFGVSKIAKKKIRIMGAHKSEKTAASPQVGYNRQNIFTSREGSRGEKKKVQTHQNREKVKNRKPSSETEPGQHRAHWVTGPKKKGVRQTENCSGKKRLNIL